MTAASSSVLGKRFERSSNSAFSSNPNPKRQKTVGEMARAAIAQLPQSKWIIPRSVYTQFPLSVSGISLAKSAANSTSLGKETSSEGVAQRAKPITAVAVDVSMFYFQESLVKNISFIRENSSAAGARRQMVFGKDYWERIFTYLRDPKEDSLLHTAFLPLAGTCHQFRTWIANMATQDITSALQRYRDLFFQIQEGLSEGSPIYTQAENALKLVGNLLTDHGIFQFDTSSRSMIQPVWKKIPDDLTLDTLIRANRHPSFRLLSRKELTLFQGQMMQIWGVETPADAQAQLQSFAAKKMQPRDLIQFELLLDLANQKRDFSSLGISQIFDILRKNPEALQPMLRAKIHTHADSRGYTFFDHLAGRDMPLALEEIAGSSLKENLFQRSREGFNIIASAVSNSALGTIFWSLKHQDPAIQSLCLNVFPGTRSGVSVAHAAAQAGQVKVLDALAKDPEKWVRDLLLQRDPVGNTIWSYAIGNKGPDRKAVLAWIRKTKLVKHLVPAKKPLPQPNRDSR